MRKRFIKFHYKLLKPVLISLAILGIFIVIYGQDSKDVKGKVIARVVYSFPNALPGEKIEIKRILTDSGKVITVSSSEKYKGIGDIDYLKKKEAELVRQKYGVLSQSLISIYETMSCTDQIKVTIKFNSSVSKQQLQMLNLSDSCEIIDNNTVVDSVDKSFLDNNKFNSFIFKIEDYREPIPLHGGDENCEECAGFIDSVYSGNAYSRSFYNFPEGVSSMPTLGSGVRIATFEGPIPSILFDSLLLMHPGVNIAFADTVYDTTWEWVHQQMSFHAMLHTAPEAELNHDSSSINPKNLIDSNIEAASRSYLGGGYSNTYDSLTYNNNSAIICIPSGNYGLAYPPNSINPFAAGDLWYNAIYLGGCIYTNNSYYEITNDEYYQFWQSDNRWHLGNPLTHIQARNPLGSDKEEPHIVGPSLVTCSGGAEGSEILHGFGGTSAATPSTVGICACIISANPALMRHNTENVRTALMVTAENIDGGYWDPMVDGRDGCGVVSGYNAAMFAQNVTRKDTLSAADTMGLAFGWIPNNPALEGTRLIYKVRTPSVFPKEKHFRAVLTWTNSQNDSATDRTLSDLNLELWDRGNNNWIDLCYSIEDNHEVIDVENYELETNKEYSLEVTIESLRFPANPIRDSIKYSLGWAWVNDYAGKKIEQSSFTGDTSIELYNRNIAFDTNTIFSSTSWSSVTAGNRIVLNPGVTIDSGAEFSASIVSQAIKYDAPPYSGSFIDHSGNRRHGQMPTGQSLERLINRYCQIYQAGSSYFDGSDYLWVYRDTASGIDTIVRNPKFYDGLTLSMWVRFYTDSVSTGYLCYSFEGDSGFYLHVDDISNTEKEFTFYVSDGFNISSVDALTVESDLILLDDRPSNDRWIHVTAVWRAGEEMELYLNGVSENESPTNITHCPSNPCFIGSTSNGTQAFKGCIDEVRLYVGADSDDHVLSEYHKHTYPNQWYYDKKNVTVKVEAGGFAHYDFTYEDIIDEEPPDTVIGGDSITFKLPFNYNCTIDAEPDNPGMNTRVVKTRLSDNDIDTVSVPHTFYIWKNRAYDYRFDITFY